MTDIQLYFTLVMVALVAFFFWLESCARDRHKNSKSNRKP